MAVFYVLLLIPMLIQHFTLSGNNFSFEKKNKHAVAFFFFFLTILVLLRHESIGTDTWSYIHHFYKISELDWNEVGKVSIEFGFSFLNKIVSLISTDPRVFLTIVAIASSSLVYPTYKRLCIDTSLTIALFCIMSTFVMFFSGMRQMLAIGIGVIAYEFTRKKKLIPFILSVILAMTFHASAFMLAFMYPVFHSKITKRWLIAIIPILSAIFVFNKRIFSTLLVILERYTMYEASISSTGAYTMLFLFVVFTVFVFLVPDDKKLDQETIGLRNFMLLALVVQLFAPLHVLAMRMNYYYIIFIPLLIPKIIRARSATWDQVAIIARYVMIVFFVVYFFINGYASNDNLDVFPYHFFWEDIG